MCARCAACSRASQSAAPSGDSASRSGRGLRNGFEATPSRFANVEDGENDATAA